MPDLIPPEDLPDYQHPNYVAIAPMLQVCEDVFNSLEGVKANYLRKAPKEPDQAYNNRVEQAVCNNKLRPTIESNAGLLTAFELSNMPPSVEAHKDNIDGKGSDFKTFFQSADIKGLRDRECFVFVDYPPLNESIVTAADLLTANRRPNFVLIDRRNVLNWRCHHEGSKLVIDSIVFKMIEEKPKGLFGVESKVVYHQLLRDKVVDENGAIAFQVQHLLWEIRTNNNNGKLAVQIAKPTILVGSDRPLTEIPIVCYPHANDPFSTENPPFLKLARLNIKLFRKESNLDEIEYRVNCPTVYREHPTIEVPSNLPPITFGSSWVIEIPAGGKVGVLEIEGTGMAQLQGSIAELKQEIASESMAFLAGSAVQRTATESFLSSAQVQASLSGYARAKSSAVQRCFDFWCAYTGEENTVEVDMDHSILEMPLDAQEMGQLMALWQADAIDHQTLLELLKMGRQLPPDTDIEEIMRRIESDRASQMATIPEPFDGQTIDIPRSMTNGMASDLQNLNPQAPGLLN